MMLPSFYQKNFFNDFFDDSFFSGALKNAPSVGMKTDIREEEGRYLLDIELPGFEKENIQAELKKGYLTISASREENNDQKDKDGNYIRKERYSGSCTRSFYVGDTIEEKDIIAQFNNGILKLEIPKEDARKIDDSKKLIEIK